MDLTRTAVEDYYTLLAVRPDGVASIVDVMAGDALEAVEARAQVLLSEHASCSSVEVWRDEILLETIGR